MPDSLTLYRASLRAHLSLRLADYIAQSVPNSDLDNVFSVASTSVTSSATTGAAPAMSSSRKYSIALAERQREQTRAWMVTGHRQYQSASNMTLREDGLKRKRRMSDVGTPTSEPDVVKFGESSVILVEDARKRPRPPTPLRSRSHSISSLAPRQQIGFIGDPVVLDAESSDDFQLQPPPPPRNADDTTPSLTSASLYLPQTPLITSPDPVPTISRPPPHAKPPSAKSSAALDDIWQLINLDNAGTPANESPLDA